MKDHSSTGKDDNYVQKYSTRDGTKVYGQLMTIKGRIKPGMS